LQGRAGGGVEAVKEFVQIGSDQMFGLNAVDLDLGVSADAIGLVRAWKND
jgi:hypothetical protein